MPASFIHLRNHSAYSLAEGALRIPQLVKLAHEHGMPAVAVTDTNNLFGAMEFSKTASKGGIQPILGCQVDIALPLDSGQRTHRDPTKRREDAASIVLLVQDEAGYKNLSKISSHAYVDSASEHGPTLAGDWLKAFDTRGLICLLGGSESPLSYLLLGEKTDEAEALLQAYMAEFDGRLYIELQRHGLREEQRLEPLLLDLAYRFNIPLVATNNCYFAKRDMHGAHDALLCIASGRYVGETDRRRETDQHYFKSASEMRELFADIPEACENTVVIAQRCAYWLKAVDAEFPVYETAHGRTIEQELEQQSHKGLKDRLESDVFTRDMPVTKQVELQSEYEERLAYELGVINQMGFPAYFLIVSDFIRWAKSQDIPVGPGRGSGGGSLVAWALHITDINPIRFGLLFERFLNPERVSLPDFDIDFCQSRRDEVIAYVQEKYGRDRVAQIITFGKLQPRAVLRDVGRVLGMPYGQVDRICKLVPNSPTNPVTLQEAIDGEAQLREMRREDPAVMRLLEIGLQLEGLYRHASTHAAGIVIGHKPLDEICPLYLDPRSSLPATQFNMKYVEDTGLVKFDFLGLKTLTVLKTAIENIKTTEGITVDINALPYDDEKSYKLLSDGHTIGVFQLESSGMRDTVKGLKPTQIEDIIALVSLYRPGPMENIPHYIKRKHGQEAPDYIHPKLETMLKETYGILVYQEQVMQLAQILAGYSLGGADLLRRAMGKKIKEAMDAERVKFVKGAGTHSDIGKEEAEHIFDLVAKFASYGFNKSHAAAYALIAYQTAYLKANYPEEFMAATMTLDMGNTDKLSLLRQELKTLGIPLLPPDINASFPDFTVERLENGRKAIRYALGAVKGIGFAAMQDLVNTREVGGPFRDLRDFIRRLDPQSMSRKQIEILSACGAFESLGAGRHMVHEAADVIMRTAQALREEKESGQVSLFGGTSEEDAITRLRLPESLPEWSAIDTMRYEFSAIGFYLTGHPLDGHAEILDKQGYKKYTDVLRLGEAKRIKLAAVVIKRQEKSSDRGKFAFLMVSDPSGLYDVTVYTDLLMATRDLLEPGALLSISADAMPRPDSEPRLIAQDIQPLEAALAGNINEIILDVEHGASVDALLMRLNEAPRQGGHARMKLRVCLPEMGQRYAVIQLPGVWQSQGLEDWVNTLPHVKAKLS